MNPALHESRLRDLLEKAVSGGRFSDAEALRLFESDDLAALGALADLACRRKNGLHATYILNRHINYSNYCVLGCRFCAFSRKPGEQGGFERSVGEMVRLAREALAAGATELHIVGGLHPSLPFDYYTGLLRALKSLEPRLQLKCFTAVEVRHLSRIAGKPLKETLAELKEAGLDALTGGGAEIFNPEIRRQIAQGKETAEEYLDTHRAWHQLGGRSTCTMLFGHLESPADRVDHLRRLRELQDETRGFISFVPLPYHPENNDIPVRHPPSGFDILRTMAASRLYLDNVDHLTAYWVALGPKLARVALHFGADDLHGTIMDEKIFHMAGAESPLKQNEAEMIRAIREAGRVPVQRDTFHRSLKIHGGAFPEA